ncbi:MAG: hypothetical protein H6R26_1803 [Proteobacteria bacterium]|nr:hypothetical protein [Pseudomonadota bacterium]
MIGHKVTSVCPLRLTMVSFVAITPKTDLGRGIAAIFMVVDYIIVTYRTRMPRGWARRGMFGSSLFPAMRGCSAPVC